MQSYAPFFQTIKLDLWERYAWVILPVPNLRHDKIVLGTLQRLPDTAMQATWIISSFPSFNHVPKEGYAFFLLGRSSLFTDGNCGYQIIHTKADLGLFDYKHSPSVEQLQTATSAASARAPANHNSTFFSHCCTTLEKPARKPTLVPAFAHTTAGVM